ncbi:OmpA family protein [Microbacter margulisiae]|uniref:Outer membrane protein OmpA-like peptidoglycan-associated protein n=1 Tax=Microbacter margulisiae TaxID=1350067 RepID=A0A7W5DNX4_9PORP|nr:OmpA family protein [Microbacter margulisiae]MBB3186404.1 outer membrane protein OmpA-like peptidoglycan-associated protein [Microbacter margulisiae]
MKQLTYDPSNYTIKHLFLMQIFKVSWGMLFLFYCMQSGYCEGTKSVSPNADMCTGLAILPSRNNGSYLHCPVSNRIYFHIKDYNTERFFYGFNWQKYGSGLVAASYIKDSTLHYKFYRKSPGKAKNVYMLIYAPDGTLAQRPILLPSNGIGHIDSYNQAIEGPDINRSMSKGYRPLVFKPKMNGEYWIEFYISNDGGRSSTSKNEWIYSPYFDLTVATSTGKKFNGRVHSAKWGLVAIDPRTFGNTITADASPTFYAMTSDGVVYRITFEQGFEPIDFNVAMTAYGVVDKGNWLEDRISRNDKISPTFNNGFPIFLNLPDSTVYSFAKPPKTPSFGNPGVIGCYPGPYLIRFILQQPSDCRLVIQHTPADSLSNRIIEIPNCKKGLNTYLWDGRDNHGKIFPENSKIELVVVDNIGRGNLPIYDAEINKGGVNIDCVAPAKTNHIRIYWDDSQLTSVGSDLKNDQDNLTGPGIDNSMYGSITPSHAWNGNGNPMQFIPAPAVQQNDLDDIQANDFGNVRTINSWFWGISLHASTWTNASCISINGKVSVKNMSLVHFTQNHHTNIFVTLIDPTTLKVLSFVQADSSGIYSLKDCPINGLDMPIILTSEAQAVGFNPTDTLRFFDISKRNVMQTVSTASSSVFNINFQLIPIDHSISITGIVKNFQTSLPFPSATVFIYNQLNHLIQIAKTNSYGVFKSSFKMPFNGNIKVFAPHYLSDCLALKIDSTIKDSTVVIPHPLFLRPFQAHIGKIFYNFNKWDIRSDAKLTLDSLVTILKKYPVKVEIYSYCDSRGSNAYNNALSKQRANAVANYLIMHGISHQQFISKGYGKHHLIFKEKNGIPPTEAQQQENRRSEFKIIRNRYLNQNQLIKLHNGNQFTYKKAIKNWIISSEFNSTPQYEIK